jgi:hypothetical protein
MNAFMPANTYSGNLKSRLWKCIVSGIIKNSKLLNRVIDHVNILIKRKFKESFLKIPTLLDLKNFNI